MAMFCVEMLMLSDDLLADTDIAPWNAPPPMASDIEVALTLPLTDPDTLNVRSSH